MVINLCLWGQVALSTGNYLSSAYVKCRWSRLTPFYKCECTPAGRLCFVDHWMLGRKALFIAKMAGRPSAGTKIGRILSKSVKELLSG